MIRIVCEGQGKPIQAIDTTTDTVLNGVLGLNFTADAKGVVCRAVFEPGEIKVEGDETQYYLIDPMTGTPRRVTSVVWAPNEKGQAEVWKPASVPADDVKKK